MVSKLIVLTRIPVLYIITWSQRVDESGQRLSVFPVGGEVGDAPVGEMLVDPGEQLLFR